MTKYDCIVVGGSIGGVLAAYNLGKKKRRVLLIEETKWIGGQFTNQGVPSDEHPFIEETGCTTSYRTFRNEIRNMYRKHPKIKETYKSQQVFNPGGGWVSRNAFEPKMALDLFHQMLEKYSNVEIMTETKVLSAKMIDDMILSLKIVKRDKIIEVGAPYFIDGTDTGDLLPITNTAYSIGSESVLETNEPNAPLVANRYDMQPITWVAAIGYEENGNYLIEKPSYYEHYLNTIMPYGESILSLHDGGLNNGEGKRTFVLFQENKNKELDLTKPPLFTYRMIRDKNKFEDHFYQTSVTLINWPQNDYIFGNIIEDDDALNHKYMAKQLTLSLIYWLQTKAPRHDNKGFGYPEIKLEKDILGTTDGLAMAPYIRESRRIKALYTIKEQDIAIKYAKEAPSFWDSVGIGLYNIDLHTTTKTNQTLFEETWPFEIPLGAFIPVQTKNLIPACKNIGTTHLTNGCYRLHPVEWNIGEVAGLLIDYCLTKEKKPIEIYQNKSLVNDFQTILKSEGISLNWADEIIDKYKMKREKERN